LRVVYRSVFNGGQRVAGCLFCALRPLCVVLEHFDYRPSELPRVGMVCAVLSAELRNTS
jgi:hypothetical protein